MNVSLPLKKLIKPQRESVTEEERNSSSYKIARKQ